MSITSTPTSSSTSSYATNLDPQRLTIGRMAELNCVSARTLRIYDEKGLLKPAARDDETGYRYYTLDQCATLDAIQRLQQLGFTLEEIGEALRTKDSEALYRSLDAKDRDVDDQISRLRRIKYEINQLKRRCLAAQTDVDLEKIKVEMLPQRCAVRFDLRNGGLPNDPDGPDGPETLHNWQLEVCNIKQQMLEMGFPPMYFGNVACCIPGDQLRAGILTYTQALVFISERDRDFAHMAEVIPMGRYVTMYCRDLSSEGGELRESQCLRHMVEYINDHGYGISGDYIGEVVLDTDLFSYSGRDELVKMQIRID